MEKGFLAGVALLAIALPGVASAQTSITALPPNTSVNQGPYGVSTDAFDVQQGATIVDNSAVIFNPDHAIGGVTPNAGEPYSVDFNGAGPGFITFKTANPVTIGGFNLFVASDGDSPASREFATIGLLGSPDGTTYTSLGSFDFTNTSYTAYGSNVLELTSRFASLTDQFFRIDAVSKAQGTAQGGRILELDAVSASPVAAVPEPASWAMMIVGFGLMGAGLRFRQRKANVRYLTA